MIINRILSVFKYLVISLAIFFVLILIGVNLPISQRFITGKANRIFREKNLPVQVDRITLLIDGRIGVTKARIIRDGGDTIIYAGKIRGSVRIFPLLFKKVKVTNLSVSETVVNLASYGHNGELNLVSVFSGEGNKSGSRKSKRKVWDIGAENVILEKVHFTYNDSINGLSFRESVEKLKINFERLSTAGKEIIVGSLVLNGAHGGISLSTSNKQKAVSKNDNVKATWKFRIRDADLRDLTFSLDQPSQGDRMHFSLKSGSISGSEFDLSENSLAVDRVELGSPGVDLWSGGNKKGNDSHNNGNPDSGFFGDISIRAGAVKLGRGFFNAHHSETAMNSSIEKQEFKVNEVNAEFSGITLNSSDAGFTLANLTMEFGNGFRIGDGDITFSSGKGSRTKLEAGIRTAVSSFNLKFESEGNITDINGPLNNIPFTLSLSDTKIGTEDILAFLPELKEDKFRNYRDLTFGSDCTLSGTLDSLGIGNIILESPWGISVGLSGWLRGVMHPESMSFSINLVSGSLSEKGITRLLETAGSKLKVPEFDPFKLQGKFSGNIDKPAWEFTLSGKSGEIFSSGTLSLSEKSYDLKLDIIGLDAGKFTGVRDLERFSARVAVRGKGFNPKKALLAATVSVDTLGFRGYSYRDITMSLNGDKGEYKYTINSPDTSFYCNLSGDIRAGDNLKKLTILGPLNIDAGRLNLVEGYSAGAEIDAELTRSGTGLEGALSMVRLKLQKHYRSEELQNLELSFRSSDSLFAGDLSSDFIKAGFRCQSSIGYLQKVFAERKIRGIAMVDSAVSNRLPFVSGLPVMKVSVETTYDPIIGLVLNDSVFGYHLFKMDMTKDSAGTTSADISVDRFNYGAIGGYGVLVNMKRIPEKSELQVITDSLKIGKLSLSHSAIDIATRGDTAICEIVVGDDTDKQLFSVSAGVFKDGSMIKFRPTQPQWIINGIRWEVSPVEFLKIFQAENDIIADLHWKNGQSSIDITGRKTEKLNMELHKVDLKMLLLKELNSPGIDGELNGTIGYSGTRSGTEIGADLGLDSIRLSESLLGNFDLQGKYTADTVGNMGGELKVVMNDSSQLDLSAGIREKGHTKELKAGFSGIPMKLLELFAHKFVSRTQGEIRGDLELKSVDNKPELNGQIGFKGAALTIVPLNARFYLADDALVLEKNKLVFDQFSVLDSLNKKLSVDGNMNLDDPLNITADLNIISDRLQVMNTTEKDNASFNGSVFVNSSLGVTGPLQKPSISGKVVLAEGSVINYRYTENLAVSETQKIITFASFKEDQNSVGRGKSGKMSFSKTPDIEASVEIDPGSLFTFQISRGFDIGASIQGGGFLNYDQMTDNTISLSGTYEIKQGSAELKIPGWPRKDFTISPGSFLKWSGPADDPELNISTSSKVRGSYYNPVEDKNREVNFIVYMKLSNRLSQLDITFDVGSNDQYITSVFNTLSADERMKQAINLLIFARIELPNMESSSDYVTQQINQFWESQINQLTKSAIKGVDLSFGIDTYKGISQGGGEQTYTSFTYEVKKEMFHNRGSVLVSGRMNDASQAGAPTNNMIENFIFEYALDTARTKYVKVYRQQDYEDLLEGEVTKSGIGFIYRKSYDRIREIWRKEKNRKNKTDNR